ncbi:hypothetical protein C0Q70_19849 [Pomacea canaliculata]|uniref:Uncharacterized protein n=1 Tax=Pomacea canaliculata TaxID=400727 RepID=A0A2T7NDW8_POMCA|nr:hypothetical protein C0Q70_19849 [Pomacea canaliculata]
MSIQARLRSVEHVLRRLEDLTHRGGDVRQRHVNTALPVTTRREVTAPQLACGSQQLLQLVQHQISGSKEVLEMGKNMASSLRCRRYKPDSGTAGSLGFSSHSNASSSICSVNPVPDLSDSSMMSFPSASTQTSSSGSGSCSDTSLSREKIERQSFKIQFL